MEDCRAETNGELRFAKLLVPSCRTVFDVGARQDSHLIELNAGCSFHLFEPLNKHYRALEARLRGRTNVALNRCALGDSQGEAWIYPHCESLIRRPLSASTREAIQVTRLDDYCRERNIQQIDFLKIDTEGFELEVLKGGRDIVLAGTRVIQFEYGGTYRDAGINLRMVFEFLGPQWCFYRIFPDHLRPITGYRRRYEDGRYANYVAARERLSVAIAGPGPLRRLLRGDWLRRKAA